MIQLRKNQKRGNINEKSQPMKPQNIKKNGKFDFDAFNNFFCIKKT